MNDSQPDNPEPMNDSQPDNPEPMNDSQPDNPEPMNDSQDPMTDSQPDNPEPMNDISDAGTSAATSEATVDKDHESSSGSGDPSAGAHESDTAVSSSTAKSKDGIGPKVSVTRRRFSGTDSNRKTENASTAKLVPILTLDEQSTTALTLFNAYLEADRARQQHKRDIKKAERAKTDAALKVRRLNKREAPSADVAEAEAAYRETVNALNRLTQNKPIKAD